MSRQAFWPRDALGLLLALVCLLAGHHAWAHPTPGSVVFVDVTVDGARIEQDVPVEELERALHQMLVQEGEPPESVVDRHNALLRAYAGQHLHASSAGGRPWGVELSDVSGHPSDDGPRALFRFTLRPPEGEASGSLQLHDDIVAHEVVSHYTTIYLRSDWAAGAVTTQPRLVGTLHAGRHDVTIAREGSFWRGLRGVVALGAEHIASGTDHLLFLFSLVLVAPLVPAGRRWGARRETRATLYELARLVTAFTVGHSLTLALGALGVITLPTAVVEAAIAASILVTALHAWRPLFARREALLASGFGLVHGLAFASSLPGRDLGRAQAAWTLLGFNLGIELAQLGLLVLVAPWLLTLARTRAYRAVRVGGAGVALVLATAWLLERTAGVPNPTASVVAWLEGRPLQLLVALASCAIVARAVERGAQGAGGAGVESASAFEKA